MPHALRFASPALVGLALLAARPVVAASNEVSVQPSPAAPGQSVTLHWLFTGKRVMLSGGRFGKGVVVTGRTYISDKPHHTTRYTFDVWYNAPEVDKATGKKITRPTHVEYVAVAEVQAPITGLNTYRDPYGWQIGYLPGWKFDSVSMPDPRNNRLIYFQKEDDSVERLAVSIVPGEQMTSKELMAKVQKSLSSTYDEPIVVSDKDLTLCGVPAVISQFTGLDHGHPDVRTQSVVAVFVKDGRGFVVSARTQASTFAARRATLERMLMSVAVAGSQARAQ